MELLLLEEFFICMLFGQAQQQLLLKPRVLRVLRVLRVPQVLLV